MRPDSDQGIDVVIITHNSAEVLPDCLSSLEIDPRADDEARVVIIDSGSGDPSYLENYPCVQLHPNLGYGTCANLGAAATDAGWLVVMNPDARISVARLRQLTALLDAGGADAGAPRLLDAHGAVQAPRIRAVGIKWRRRSTRNAALELTDDYTEVEVLQGSIMVFRRSSFTAVGGFDSAFFLYSEEDDLSVRMREAGSKIILASNIYGTHVGEGSSSGVTSQWRLAQRLRGRWQYFGKHFSTPEAALVIARDLWRHRRAGGFAHALAVFRIALRNPRSGVPM